ncbi:hypothetical protein IU469_28580 [Nocardia puris]|uniref:hypothetical protein n=1 Tax=Nocardia puris TaxID=208602 RepID=UPI0018937637|nr:hypothetical protein [Nocardia puris]MBF6369645.1 hypothetical protein [Nocardia puris]
MKLSWMAAPALLVATMTGCSDDNGTEEATTTPVSTSATASEAAPASEPVDIPGAVRIPLGESVNVPVPADAVLDINAPAEWGDAASAVRCTVTDGTGRNEDLRSEEPRKQEEIGGKRWITLWTFSSPPGAEVTVGCADADNAVTDAALRYVLVVPRGVLPG